MVRTAVLLTVLLVTACRSSPSADAPPLQQPVQASRAAQPDEQWITEIAAADPAFGGGHHVVQRVIARMNHETAFLVRGDDVWQKVAPQQMSECDRAAAEQARRLAPRRDEAVLVFWRSEAGRALASAESHAMASLSGGSAIREFAGFVSDPKRLENAPFDPTTAFHADYLKPLVFHLAARMLQPAHLAEIGAFYRSDAGRRWLAIREQAMPDADQRCAAFYDALGEKIRRGMICPPVGG